MNTKYKARNVERAHHWMVKAYDTLAEAQTLTSRGQTRLGAYSRLYYATHHICRALLWLIGKSAKSHSAIKTQFSKEWVKQRKFPASYVKLLTDLFRERRLADYGEYVPTLQRDLSLRLRKVEGFRKRAAKEIPPISTSRILEILTTENPEIRDFSFDVYCPKSYLHHTRITYWSPKGRVTDKSLKTLLNAAIRSLRALRVAEAMEYVLGLNSRVNQYDEKQIVMLDFDNVSTFPAHKLKREPGFLFRTESGYHFLGSRLYDKTEWRKRMRLYSKIASRAHYQFSMKRGYATLRLTVSPRKPYLPAYVGRVGQ